MSFYDIYHPYQTSAIVPECRYCSVHVPNTGDLCATHSAERERLVDAAMVYISSLGGPSHECISLYPWDKTPEALRALSDHGGDEDWLAALPPGIPYSECYWLDLMGVCGEPSEYKLRDGWVVLIGAHA